MTWGAELKIGQIQPQENSNWDLPGWDVAVMSTRELPVPFIAERTNRVSEEEAYLFLTDDSSCKMELAGGIPMACLLLVKLSSDSNGAGGKFGICGVGCTQGP